ncbi:MAG: aminopeptidase P family protein [Sphingomonadales bacterium]|nr:aminopeptidase P family protein [Sphingomonadales bacterium]
MQTLTDQKAREVLANDSDVRFDALMLAEQRAFAMLSVIEERRLIRQGRTEREIEQDILNIAQIEFGIDQHWHKRIVRSGKNTLAVFADNPPVREVLDDDLVFVDLGPVFDDWEADIGKTYVIGSNPEKIALVHELERQFELINTRLIETPSITAPNFIDMLVTVRCRQDTVLEVRSRGTSLPSFHMLDCRASGKSIT